MNPVTSIRGGWSVTEFHAMCVRCGLYEDVADMFYGSIWKKVIIERHDRWTGIRNDPVTRPTFPNRGITQAGKTYLIDQG